MTTIGEELKQARLNKNLDYEQIYNDIRISANVLKALEDNTAVDALGYIYTKNFLRQYASYLGLDSRELVARFAELHEAQTQEKQKEQQGPEPAPAVIADRPARKIPPKLIYALVFLALVALALLGIIKGIDKIRTSIPSKQSAPAPEEKEITPAAISIPKKQPLKLIMKTTEAVWVKLSADGRVITQNIIPAESRESWQANEYFILTLGKPEAVELTLNGNNLPIPENKRIRDVRIDHKGLKIK